MDKRARLYFWIAMGILLLIVIGGLIYIFLFSTDNSGLYGAGKIEVSNPAENKSIEEGVQNFDESYVWYLLYSMRAYNLHGSLTGDEPRIEIDVEDSSYNAVVQKGVIKVSKSSISNEDIIIKTSKEEIVKVLKNQSYVSDSFKSGKSSFEMVADKVSLASKGYLVLYKEFTDSPITASVIRTFSD